MSLTMPLFDFLGIERDSSLKTGLMDCFVLVKDGVSR
jgi:hypothetical protein